MSPFGRNPLLVPELFQCTLDHCFSSLGDSTRSENQTLAALAQTCRAFSEPSLDRLWRKLDSLYPLIQCFTPRSQVTASHHEDEKHILHVGGMNPPTLAEWAIVKRYSHRIRELSIDEIRSLSFLKGIGSQTSLLLPNLRVLVFRPSSYYMDLFGSVDLIRPLLSPTLVKLEANLIDEDGERLLLFLRSYHLQCPHLEDVAFYFNSREPEDVGEDADEDEDEYAADSEVITRELSRAPCSHKRLERLKVVNASIDATGLKWLSASQTIKVLSIEHDPVKSIRHPYFRPEDTPFPHVEELELRTPDLDFVISLLRPRDQIFHSLHLYLYDQPTVKATSKFFSTLASRQPEDVHSIKSVHFYAPPPAEAPEAQLELTYLSHQSLLPLTSFSNLRELVINWSHATSLNDNELALLACNWPSLRVFALNCRYVFPLSSAKHLTLKALLILVASCPDLVDICLPLDAMEVPTDADPDIRSTSVQNLAFPNSPINGPLPVANFLFRHFPRLISVSGEFRWYWMDMPPWKYTWERVDFHLSRLRRGSI